jgi:Domain of unknown function (DUF4249)
MKKLLYALFILLTAGCKEKYESPVKSPNTGYLVVEGSINGGAGLTTLTLTRTTKLDDRTINYEQGAQVQVEGEDGSSFYIFPTGPGRYSEINLNLNKSIKYRLRIKTNDSKEYLSDYEMVKTTPPIDSISWKRENGGLQLYINTHDPLNNTRYYQWEFEETWEIHSAYPSVLKYNVFQVPPLGDVYRLAYRDNITFSFDPKLFFCWQSNTSSNLLLGSSAKLSKDVINLPLELIPEGSRKLSVLYSINVKQYSWTKAGYEFLERMKKNTEATGSVFDAQPSELKGNIRCISDPNEPVIGYINISNTEEKRIFIRKDQLFDWRYNSGCIQAEIENNSDSIKAKGLQLMPTVPAKVTGQGIVTFYAASPTCVDCTLSGTNIKPVFWP